MMRPKSTGTELGFPASEKPSSVGVGRWGERVERERGERERGETERKRDREKEETGQKPLAWFSLPPPLLALPHPSQLNLFLS